MKPTMKQTITVKHLPCTTHKPARLKAIHSGGVESITVPKTSWDSTEPWEYAHHHYLACKLADKLGWEYPTGCGVDKDNNVVFTFTLLKEDS
jgi:hypothetical protein